MSINNFESAKEYLFSRIQFGMKSGLQNISQLCTNLGNPEKKIRCIHVAGTNGKGSTSFYISSLLSAHGYKTGLFTSPHLVSVRERIRIDNTPISEADLTKHTAIVQENSADIENTFFETITAIAFNYFAEQNIDFAIIETGLGGRLDSTNICNSMCTVITSIALDHTAILGNSKSEILNEKLGILKQGVPLFYNLNEERLILQTEEYALKHTVVATKLPLHTLLTGENTFSFRAHKNNFSDITLTNPGSHYQENASLALLAVESLISNFTADTAHTCLENIVWPARMQILTKNNHVDFILDGGHNPAGIRAMLTALGIHFPNATFTFMIAVLEDKDLRTMARLIEPFASEIIITKSSHEKSQNPEQCAQHFLKPVKAYHSIDDALKYSKTKSGPVICTGSLYFMGDLIEKLKWDYSELTWFQQFTPDSNESK